MDVMAANSGSFQTTEELLFMQLPVYLNNEDYKKLINRAGTLSVHALDSVSPGDACEIESAR